MPKGKRKIKWPKGRDSKSRAYRGRARGNKVVRGAKAKYGSKAHRDKISQALIEHHSGKKKWSKPSATESSGTVRKKKGFGKKGKAAQQSQWLSRYAGEGSFNSAPRKGKRGGKKRRYS